MAKTANMIRLALNAKSGDVLAQSELGIRLYTGDGIKTNYREAVKWLTLASDAGDADATCVLGSCLLYGRGIEQNSRRALLMFEKAAEKGCVEARKICPDVRRRMSPRSHWSAILPISQSTKN